MRGARSLVSLVAVFAMLLYSVTPAFALPQNSIQSVAFRDSSTGYGAGWFTVGSDSRGFLSVTNDGGLTWSAITSTSAGQLGPMRGTSYDPVSGWASAGYDDYAYHSLDATTWAQGPAIKGGGTATSMRWNDTAVTANGRIIAGGQWTTAWGTGLQGKVAEIAWSSDGGAPWTETYVGPKYYPTGDVPPPQTDAEVLALDATGTAVWAVGNENNNSSDNGAYRPLVYLSTDSGTSFSLPKSVNVYVQKNLNDVVAFDANTAIVGGNYGQVIVTTNGGASWVSKPIPRNGGTTGPLIDVYGIDALDVNHIVAAGGADSGDSAMIAFSNDGGTSWQYWNPAGGNPGAKLRSVKMIDANNWIATGDNELVVRTSDAGLTWTVQSNNTPPSAAITWPSTSTTLTGSSAQIGGTAADSGSGVAKVEVSIARNGTEWWNGTGWQGTQVWLKAGTMDGWAHWIYNWNLDPNQKREKTYTISARPEDGVGLSSTTSVANITVNNYVPPPPDTTPPSLVATVTPTSAPSVVLSATATDDRDPNPTIQYAVDAGGYLTYTGPVTLSPAVGSHVVHVKATDSSNNTSPVQNIGFEITSPPDTTPPTITVTSTGSYTQSASIRASATDNTPGTITMWSKRDSEATATYTPNDPIIFNTDGTYTVVFTARDAVGNESSRTAQVVVDKQGPVISPPLAVGSGTEHVSVTATGTDDVSGLKGMTYTINGGSPNSYTSGDRVKLDLSPTYSPRDYTIAFTATDNAGNPSSQSASVTVHVSDTTRPVLTMSAVGDRSTRVVLTATANDTGGDPTPSVQVSSDNGNSWTKFASFAQVVYTTPGTYYVRAVDWANNTSSPDQSFTVASPTPPPPPHTPATVWRIPGANRYDVAVNIATQLRASRGAPFTDVVVACGEDRAMADPLGAAALAGAYGAPVLLTPSAKTNAGMLASIAAMRDANGGHIDIHVVGGTSSIPKTVYDQIASRRGSGTCERLNGRDRYDLARVMAQRTGVVLASKGRSVPAVMVVNIENPSSFADALSASPISAHSGVPLIGVRGAGVPGEALTALSYFPGAKRYAVNSAYLTPNVRAATGCDATPMAGSANREVAATQIASFAVGKGLVGWHNVGLANKLSDALPAGAMVGELDGVMLYTNAAPLSVTTSALLAQVKGSVDHGWVFGGDLTIAPSTQTEFANALK